MKFIDKNRNFILLTIGTLLVVISFCLLLYDKFVYLKSNVYDEIELAKYRENNSNEQNVVNQNDDEIVDNVETDEIEEENNNNNSNVNTNNKTSSSGGSSIKKEYIGYLQIEKINLKQGLVSKNSYYNNVNRNIQILKQSSMLDKEKGNVILASHSGTSSISYFKNLYKLSIGDEAKIFYKGNVYLYKIVNIYNVPKNGTVEIKRDYTKSCLTLITCTKNSKTEQTVYILNRISVTKDGGN